MSKQSDPNEPWPGFNAPRDSADAVMQDRVRVAGILDSAEGKRYPRMARELALKRGMGVDEAVSLLAMLDAENPAAAADSPYLRALEKEASITLGEPAAPIGGDPKAERRAQIKRAGAEYARNKGFSRERA